MPRPDFVVFALSACLLVGAGALPAHAQMAPAAPLPEAAAPDALTQQLTLDEAVRLALDQNLDVQVERLNPLIQDEAVALANASFLPTLNSNMVYDNADSPPDSFLSGSTGTVLQTDSLQATANVRQQLRWGGGLYTFGWDGIRSTNSSIFQDFNPRLSSNLRFSLVQPLLRDRSVDANRAQLVVTRHNRTISDIDLRTKVVQTVRNVKNAYWDLKYAINNLAVQQQSLDLARQTLKDNRTRVDVGTMAPIDIVEAEAEVARNEETTIVAEADIRAAEDRLRTLILDPTSPDFWQVRIDPVDVAQRDPVPIDVDAALRRALDTRTDAARAREGLATIAENLRYYRNQTLPQINAQLDYGLTGLGGTQFQRGEGFPGPVIGEVSRGFGSVLGDVFRNSYPTWTFSLLVSYPLGRNTSEVTFARTRVEQTQAQLQLRNIDLQIGAQVRDAGRQVTTNIKRIDATRAARVLADRRLEAEQKKFGVGMSTSFLVFQAQRDLSTARSNELRAILDYNKSLADFEAVQEASLSGSGIVLTDSSLAPSTVVSAATTGGTTATRSAQRR